MKFSTRSATFLSFLFAAIVFIWLYKSHPVIIERGVNEYSHEKEEVSGGDDDGWGEYEIMRLADPATGKIPDGIRVKELMVAATLPKDADTKYQGRLRGGINFINRGPWNVGGRTRAFAIDVANHNTMIAGTPSGDIYRSTDKGNTWASVTPVTTLKGITCICQDTRSGHTNTWYAGTGEAFGGSAGANGAYYYGNGILKSTDNGLTWSALASTTTNTNTSLNNLFQLVWRVVIDPSRADSDIVYAATYGSLYRSKDGGTTWTAVITGNSYFTDVAITSKGVVYATMSDDGSQKGIWRSANGLKYTNIIPHDITAPLDTLPHYNRFVIGINPSDENTVYFLGNTPGSGMPDTNFLGEIQYNSLWRYHYISGDSTTITGTWNNLSANMPNTGTTFDKFDSQGSYNLVVSVKPDDSNAVFIGCTNIFRSTSAFNDATHTTKIGGYKVAAHLPVVENYPVHHPDQHVIFFDPDNPNILYSGNDGGLFKTNNCMAADAVIWQTFNNGYVSGMFYTVALDHATPNDSTLVGGLQDNGSYFVNSNAPNKNWVLSLGGDGSYCAIADNKSAYYLSIQNGKTVRLLLDANGNRTSFTRIDPPNGRNFLFVNPFCIDPADNSKMYMGGGTKLFRNNNLNTIPMIGGWDSISTNWVLYPDTVIQGKISTITCSTQPAHTLFYGTSGARVYKITNANTGLPIRKEITGTAFPKFGNTNSPFVSCVAVDPHDANNLIVAFSNYGINNLFYSTDGGTTWIKVAGNLKATNGPSIRWATFAHLPDGHTAYFVATSTGIYAADSLGVNTVWVQQGANTIGNEVCNMMDYRESDGLLAVATHSKGIYTANISSINDITAAKDIEVQNIHLVNYPNPFNSETNISYSLQKPAYLTISIYDMLGRQIALLQNNMLESEGKHNLTVNTAQFKSGVYLCRLTGNGISETVGMLKN